MERTGYLRWVKNMDVCIAGLKQERYFDFINSAAAGDDARFRTFFEDEDFVEWQSAKSAPVKDRRENRFRKSNPWGHPDLRRAIAARYMFDPEGIVLTAGASLAMFIVCRALLKNGDGVLIEVPTYDPFIAAASTAADIKVYPLHRRPPDFELDIDEIERYFSSETLKMVILSNLHNPTGHFTEAVTLSGLAKLAESFDVPVVFDEVFRDLGPSEYRSSLPPAPAAQMSTNFISISSLSKSYGLGLLRCGWILAGERYRRRIAESQVEIENIGSQLTQALSAKVIENIDHFKNASLNQIQLNRKVLQECLEGPLQDGHLSGDIPSYGTMYFPAVSASRDVDSLVGRLAEKNVFVVPGKFFGAPRHIRIGFGGFVEEVSLRDGLNIIAEELKASGQSS